MNAVAGERRENGAVIIDRAAFAFDLALECRACRRMRAQHLHLDSARYGAVVGDPRLGPQVLARIIGKQAHSFVTRPAVPALGDGATLKSALDEVAAAKCVADINVPVADPEVEI